MNVLALTLGKDLRRVVILKKKKKNRGKVTYYHKQEY